MSCYVMLYNIKYVMLSHLNCISFQCVMLRYITYLMLCYITCNITYVMLCYMTCVMLCYITKYVMLRHINCISFQCVMLCYITYIMLCDITCYITYVMLYNMCHIIVYNICHVMNFWCRKSPGKRNHVSTSNKTDSFGILDLFYVKIKFLNERNCSKKRSLIKIWYKIGRCRL